jgi:hypothetical protein
VTPYEVRSPEVISDSRGYDLLPTEGAALQSDGSMSSLPSRPRGHWNDTNPFIRLHQPSAYYGVNSMPLGADTIDGWGVNAGMYERASVPADSKCSCPGTTSRRTCRAT